MSSTQFVTPGSPVLVTLGDGRGGSACLDIRLSGPVITVIAHDQGGRRLEVAIDMILRTAVPVPEEEDRVEER